MNDEDAAAAATGRIERRSQSLTDGIIAGDMCGPGPAECRRLNATHVQGTPTTAQSIKPNHRATNLKHHAAYTPARPDPTLFGPCLTNMSRD